MKLTTGKLAKGILAVSITMTAGATLTVKAAAQNPDAIDNARSVAKSLQQKQDNDSNAALNAAGVPSSAKPAPGAPAPAVKPAAIPSSKPAPAAATKPAPAPASTASSAHNQLQRVSVLQDGDAVRIELSASAAVTPRVSKLSSPARVLVELPGTIDATAKNHIAVGTAGIKSIRIGTDGKTPPTTSVVVDLDKACAYEMTPSAGDKLALILHTAVAPAAAPTAAKSSPASVPAKAPAQASAQAKTPAPAAQPQIVAKAVAPVKPQAAAQPAAPKAAPAAKPEVKTEAKKTEQVKSAPAKIEATKTEAPKPATQKPEVAKDAKAAATPATDATKAAETKPKAEDKKWAMSGKRDPFFSPVVQQGGSGCSTGKKCLEIGNINLRGVVKSDTGFIAVVTNSLNKAYFLRENDPVFNGYVVKITNDSVVFQETVEDKLGKSFTREVVKRIYIPAV
jgi:Tfp pilus assembly protein PilP